MWITSFFPRTVMNEFSYYGYYPVERVAPPDMWMLERKVDATSVAQIVERRDVGDGYQLVRRTPVVPARLEVVSHDQRVGAGGRVAWKVRVVNSGTTTWRSSLDDAQTGLSVTVGLHGSTYASIDRLTTAPLPSGTVVRPGGSIDLEGETLVPAQIEHDFSLQFDLFSVASGSFQVWTPESMARVTVP